MKNKLFIAILIMTLLCGCGYTTHSALPTRNPSIYVDNFVNKIDITREISDENIYYAYRPGMESDITREIIDRFIFDGNYRVKDMDTARFLLKGQLIDFRREPLRYDTNENVVEYRISVVVNIELYDKEKKKIVWTENSFAGESTYRTSGQYAKSESVAAKEAMDDLAQRIVERTVEDW